MTGRVRFLAKVCSTSEANDHQLKFPQACDCAVKRLSVSRTARPLHSPPGRDFLGGRLADSGPRLSGAFKRNQTSVFCHDGLLISPLSSRKVTSMKAMFVILVLALIAITFELYSDASLTSAEFSHPSVPDPASAAIAHGLKHG
jgi:hypothetical protein